MTASLTFIIPGLLDPVACLEQVPEQELPELPLFNKILSRGEFTIPLQENTQPYNLYSSVFTALTGYENPADLPLASLLYRSETQPIKDRSLKQQWLMRVDPCIMIPDRDQLLLRQMGTNSIDMSEAELLVQEINDFYHNIPDQYQWTLYALAPEHWYLVCEQSIDLATYPPEKALNKPLKKFLPTGKDSQYWINLLNEFQMILHRSPVNQARIKQGKAALNSVWFWGNGPFDPPQFLVDSRHKITTSRLFSNLDYVKGLGSYFQVDYCPMPEQLKQDNIAKQGNTVLVNRDFIDAIEQGDLFQWLELLKAFEVNYLVRIIELLTNKSIGQCELLSPSGRRLLLTKRLLARFWRKNRLYREFLVR